MELGYQIEVDNPPHVVCGSQGGGLVVRQNSRQVLPHTLWEVQQYLASLDSTKVAVLSSSQAINTGQHTTS